MEILLCPASTRRAIYALGDVGFSSGLLSVGLHAPGRSALEPQTPQRVMTRTRRLRRRVEEERERARIAAAASDSRPSGREPSISALRRSLKSFMLRCRLATTLVDLSISILDESSYYLQKRKEIEVSLRGCLEPC